MLLVTALVGGLLGLGADASSHPQGGQVTAAGCVVQGKVTADFSHYEFQSATIQCSGTFHNIPDVATYSVTAEGDTKAIGGSGPDDCNSGESRGAGTLNATRTSTVTGVAPSTLSGGVHFIRVGPAVRAFGNLTQGDNHQVRFEAQLSFTPEDESELMDCINHNKVTADLNGYAEVTDRQI